MASTALLPKTQKCFYKMKRGNVVKVLREVYLRDDLECGSAFCEVCPTRKVLEKDAACYIVPDTNICLHQIDALESPLIRNVIFLTTVLDEVRNQNRAVYARLKQIISDESRAIYYFCNEFHKATFVEKQAGEIVNDRNDRAIRVAVEWYSRHLSAPGAPKVILVTHDVANRRLAEESGIEVMSLRNYVSVYMKDNQQILDKLSTKDDPMFTTKKGEKSRYVPHLDRTELTKLCQAGKLCQGKMHTNTYNYREGTVRLFGEKYPEVFVFGVEDMNRALDGDTVGVEILPPGQWKKRSRKIIQRDEEGAEDELDTAADEATNSQYKVTKANMTEEQAIARGLVPSARVRGIIKAGRREYCGVVDIPEGVSLAGSLKLIFHPQSKKIPRVRIGTKTPELLKGKRLVVTIDDWPEDSSYPNGHYSQILGDIGDKDTEAKVVLIENDIPFYEFPPEVIACLPQDDWCITEEEIAKRWDIRDRFVCSVDPPGCKDIDDALHVRELPNGNLEVGVHIADVTHFLEEGSAMDLEATKRGTSVYLTDRRIDMLPKLLTEILCSVRGNEESLTFSVVWEMTLKCEIVATKFARTVVHSKAALSYEQAWKRIEDKEDNSEITKGLRHLFNLSRILKDGRKAKGALDLASQEMRVKLDPETGEALSVEAYTSFPTCSMIEEFMLLANVSVARHIYTHFPTFSLLRRHPAPSEEQFDTLQEALKNKGLKPLDLTSSGALAASLDKTTLPNDPFFNTLVRMMTTRCMQQAKYFSSGEFERADYTHYGLASDIYTHFTSPIRRYSDDVVHRQLAATLGLINLTEHMTDKQKMHDIAENLNYRHTQAQYASRDSTNMHTGFFFKGREEITEAYVIHKRENGIAVLVPKFGIEGIVYIQDPQGNPLPGIPDLKIFDKTTVCITISTDDAARNKLIFKFTDAALVGHKRPLQESTQPATGKPDTPTSTQPAKKKQKKAKSS